MELSVLPLLTLRNLPEFATGVILYSSVKRKRSREKAIVSSKDVPVLTAAIPERNDLWETCVSLIKLELCVGKDVVRSNVCDRSRGS